MTEEKTIKEPHGLTPAAEKPATLNEADELLEEQLCEALYSACALFEGLLDDDAAIEHVRRYFDDHFDDHCDIHLEALEDTLED